ncbi:MAG: DUF3795 domain-containing protein [Deltaproteobacteria bacterium]|nr:DUF3795 domain-containing protein [Deltaproteobacteria bacterium]
MPATAKMISRCGLVCTDCPAYKATKAKDEKLAAETAKLWSKLYHADVTVSDVWCNGCIGRGKKCAHYAECDIRKCAQRHRTINCGHCARYGCDTITGFFKMVPDAKKVLDREHRAR